MRVPSTTPTSAVSPHAVPAGPASLALRSRALSLDIVAGVLAAGSLAAFVADARMPAGWWIALAAGTWTVYALDHLADARRSPRPAPAPRHRLFQRRAAPLRAAAAAAALVAALAALGMPAPLVFGGLAPAGLAALHLVWIRRASGGPPKELSTAIVYALALWYGPWLLRGPGAPPPAALAALALAHVAAALANLLLISLVERSLDRAGGQRSWVLERGAASARRALVGCAAVGASAALAAATLAPGRGALAALLLGALAVLPAALRGLAEAATDPERVRARADLAFLALAAPALLALLAG